MKMIVGTAGGPWARGGGVGPIRWVAQKIIGRTEVFEYLRGDQAHRPLTGKPLQFCPYLVSLSDLPRRWDPDDGASVRNDIDQAAALKLAQCLPNGRSTDSQQRGQLSLTKLSTDR